MAERTTVLTLFLLFSLSFSYYSALFDRFSHIKRWTTATVRPLGRLPVYGQQLLNLREWSCAPTMHLPCMVGAQDPKFPEKFDNSSPRGGEIDVRGKTEADDRKLKQTGQAPITRLQDLLYRIAV